MTELERLWETANAYRIEANIQRERNRVLDEAHKRALARIAQLEAVIEAHEEFRAGIVEAIDEHVAANE